MLRLTAVLFAAALAACTTQAPPAPAASPPAPPPSVAQAAPAADARIILQQGCYSPVMTCPVYRIELSPDGSFRYEGMRNANPPGVVEGRLAPDSWARAEAAFAAAGWDRVNDRFMPANGAPCMPDSPEARFTRRTTAGVEKAVGYSLGCRNEAAMGLLNALNAIMPAPAAPPADKSELALWESGCFFPTCVSYQMWLKPDGSYRLECGANARTPCAATGTLGADAWARAQAALAEAQFASMPTNLTVSQLNRPGGVPCINDLPDVAFTLTAPDGTDRAVRWSTGCSVPAARKLLADLRAIFRYDDLVRKPQ
jgi:hypothetical protein